MAKTTGNAVSQPTESLAERHAWKVLLALSGIIIIFGAGDVKDGGSTYQTGEAVLMQGVSGTSWNELQAAYPRVANLVDLNVRNGGSSLLALGLLSAAVCLTGLRRGERWAWYAMWIWPLWIVLTVAMFLTVPKAPGAGTPVPVFSGSLFFVVSVLALTLSYRKYFPKQL